MAAESSHKNHQRGLAAVAWHPSPLLMPPFFPIRGIPTIIPAPGIPIILPLLTPVPAPIPWARLHDARLRRGWSWWCCRCHLRLRARLCDLCQESGLGLGLQPRRRGVPGSCAAKLLHLCIHAWQVSRAKALCRHLGIRWLACSSAKEVLRSLVWCLHTLRQPWPRIHLWGMAESSFIFQPQ